MKPLSLDNKIKLQLSEAIDPSLLKTRKSGGTDLTYITQNTCIDILNEVFGYMWSFEIVERLMEPGITQIKMENPKYPFTEKNTDMSAVKTNPEGKRYIELPQLPSAWVLVKLTVPMVDDNGNIVYISKMATGSQAINGPQSTQSINGYKGAQSDALKKAASLFGIALELYRDSTEEEHFQTIRNTYMPDTWTEEAERKYAKELNVLYKLLEEYEWSFDDIGYYVSIATNDAYNSFRKMPAEYIDALIKAIREDA